MQVRDAYYHLMIIVEDYLIDYLVVNMILSSKHKFPLRWSVSFLSLDFIRNPSLDFTIVTLYSDFGMCLPQ